MLVIVGNAALTMGVQVSLQSPFSFSLGTCPEVRLLGHIEVLFLIIRETSALFCTGAALTYIPPILTRVPFSPHPYQHLPLL